MQLQYVQYRQLCSLREFDLSKMTWGLETSSRYAKVNKGSCSDIGKVGGLGESDGWVGGEQDG